MTSLRCTIDEASGVSELGPMVVANRVSCPYVECDDPVAPVSRLEADIVEERQNTLKV